MLSFVRPGAFAFFAFTLPALAAPSSAQLIYHFDGPASIAAMHVSGASAEWSRTVEDGAEIEAVPEKLLPDRSRAAHLVLTPGRTWTTVEIRAASGLNGDWSGREKLVFCVHNGSEFMIPFVLNIRDAAGATFSADRLWMVRARNRFEIPLDAIRSDSGSPLDLRHLQSLSLEMRSAEKFERDLWLYHFYLAGTAPVGRPPGEVLLDFGPQGAPLLAGAEPVDERTTYAKWRGYGWTGDTGGFTTAHFNQPKPDPMLGSLVWADLGSRAATLRVDLPDGEYRARFWGGNYTAKVVAGREFELAVNGRTVAARKADPETFYTAAEYFRGINDWYQPGEDTWVRRARDLYQHYDFRFTVKGGRAEFTWSKTLAVFGLLIAPETAFDKAIERVEHAQRAAFEANLDVPRPAARDLHANAGDDARGFILWSRDWQKTPGPYDAPDAAERDPAVLRLTAAQGQRVHATLTMTPLRSLGAVDASVTGSLPAAIQVRAVKYMWEGWPASLDLLCLFPTQRAPAYGRVNLTWWFTVALPADAKPGLYSGSVQLRTESGAASSVPLRLQVLPFRLPNADEHGVAYSLWRNSDYNMSYALRCFLPAKTDYFRRLLSAEAADMKAHGMTAFHFTAPAITGVAGDHVTLDFRLLEEECRAVKEYGLSGPGRPGLVFLPLEISRKLMKETRYGDFQEPEEMSPMLPDAERVEEFSDLFNRRFLDAVRQIQDFFGAQGIPVMMQPADEPRERNINQWNRNRAECIHYADLIHKALPRVKLYVDAEADEDAGVDYMPLLDHFDIIATHPWDRSAKIVARTQTGKPVLRYYNGTIGDRYDWGFQIAASNSSGLAQWHFGWQLQPFQPFHAEGRSGFTLAGPDGPLDTAGYEVIAAGIDDFRYVATLRARIAEAKKAAIGDPAIADAEAALRELAAGSEPYAMRGEYSEHPAPRTTIAGRSLDEWRARLAGCIMAIDRSRSGQGN